MITGMVTLQACPLVKCWMGGLLGTAGVCSLLHVGALHALVVVQLGLGLAHVIASMLRPSFLCFEGHRAASESADASCTAAQPSKSTPIRIPVLFHISLTTCDRKGLSAAEHAAAGRPSSKLLT